MGDADGRVGYGRPPVEHRFKLGQSGNPRGRPRRDPDPTSNAADDVYLRELSRQIPVTERGAQSKITALEAIARAQIMAAIKGDPRAQEALGRRATDIHKRRRAEIAALLKREMEMRQQWRELCAEYQKAGLPRPLRFPDPDDVAFDWETGSRAVFGPQTPAEAVIWQEHAEFQGYLRETIRRVKVSMALLTDLYSVDLYRRELDTWQSVLGEDEKRFPNEAARRSTEFDFWRWYKYANSEGNRTKQEFVVPYQTMKLFLQVVQGRGE